MEYNLVDDKDHATKKSHGHGQPIKQHGQKLCDHIRKIVLCICLCSVHLHTTSISMVLGHFQNTGTHFGECQDNKTKDRVIVAKYHMAMGNNHNAMHGIHCAHLKVILNV